MNYSSFFKYIIITYAFLLLDKGKCWWNRSVYVSFLWDYIAE